MVRFTLQVGNNTNIFMRKYQNINIEIYQFKIINVTMLISLSKLRSKIIQPISTYPRKNI